MTKLKFRNRIRDAFIGLSICLASIPFAVAISFLGMPLWRWFESTFAIETVGHSGPASWVFLTVYFGVIAASGAVWSLSRRKRKGDKGSRDIAA